MDKVATSAPPLNTQGGGGGGAQMATWPKCAQSGHITTALLGVPNAHRGDKNQKQLCSLDVDKVAISHLPSQGSPTLNTRRKHINGYAAQMRTRWLHHPCRLEGLKRLVRRQKSEIAMHPRCGQSGYITPALLGVPNAQHEEKTHKWLCGPNLDKVATSLLPSRRAPTLGTGRKIRNGYATRICTNW